MNLNGERLRNARKYKKMTMDNLISEMSSKFGISATKSMISQWENNKVTPRVETLEKLSILLEAPIEYLAGSNNFGFAIMDYRFRSGLSIKEVSIATEHSERYLNFIEKYHVLKKSVDLFIFSILLDTKDINKEFNEKYGISLIPSLEALKNQLLESEEIQEQIQSKSKVLLHDDFKQFLMDTVITVHRDVISIFQGSNYFDALSNDLDWLNSTFKKLMNTTLETHQSNQIINLNDLSQETTVFLYNKKIISIKDRNKILKMLEMLFEDDM